MVISKRNFKGNLLNKSNTYNITRKRIDCMDEILTETELSMENKFKNR